MIVVGDLKQPIKRWNRTFECLLNCIKTINGLYITNHTINTIDSLCDMLCRPIGVYLLIDLIEIVITDRCGMLCRPISVYLHTDLIKICCILVR